MDQTTIPDFKPWHEIYSAISPYTVIWHIGTCAYYERLWFDTGKVLCSNDFRLTLRFIAFAIKLGKRKRESFKMYNLMDPERFLYDLDDARAEKSVASRAQKVTERTKILLSSGMGSDQKEKCTESSAEVLAKMMDDWEKMKAAIKQ